MDKPGAFAEAFKHGIDVDNIDGSVDCKCDFYNYANGSWLKGNPIPDEYSAWGSFLELRDLNLERCKNLLTTEQDNLDENLATLRKMCGNFYNAGMDEKAIDNSDPNLLLKLPLDLISSMEPTTESITSVIATFHKNSTCENFFNFGSGVGE